ncbi:MAG TPA: TlpA disulfide reductase family protein [Microthrixaceae bacterium]|nr:TlpA disulfide reductase family protein [Microthrixaceae bacterium]
MKWRAPLVAGIVGVAVLLLVVLFAISPKGEDAKSVRSPLLGKLVKPLAGTTISGDEVDIDQFRGEWVLINFFASWCPPCVVEHPELRKLSKDDGGPLQVVSVVSQDTVKNAREFFAKNGGSWPVLGGDTGPISIDFGLKKVPESFLVAPTGVVVAKFEGAVTYDEIVKQIEKMSATSETKDSTKGGS